ncbi:pentatricopeptide repeat-containing protein At1g62680, mitochondrial-like [Prosopis cineraria]|uniref:pentatricopeptide repeat-containing protein At1g62680, mitochondrial-like n=1 Tax=Prosopis cineraria TaxID=364024 RepID=UPI00241062C8|nr:pentatricopeptide repeat-containing protein At1g62680, mitochondrial-like [Prosopis cineraria]
MTDNLPSICSSNVALCRRCSSGLPHLAFIIFDLEFVAASLPASRLALLVDEYVELRFASSHVHVVFFSKTISQFIVCVQAFPMVAVRPASWYAFCKFPLLLTSSTFSFLHSLPFALATNFSFGSYSSNPRNTEEFVASFHAFLHRNPRRMTLSFFALGKILKVGCQPDTITLNTLLKGLCINNDVGKALDFHDDLIEKGFQLDRVSYGTLINKLCKTRKTRFITEARDLFHEMINLGMSLNAVTYNCCLIHGFCSIDNWLKVAKLFKQMKLKGINPNIHTFNILVGAFCKGRCLTKAKAIVGMMIKKGAKLDEVTYGSLMDGYYLIHNVGSQESSWSEVIVFVCEIVMLNALRT